MKRNNELNSNPRTIPELLGADYDLDMKRHFKEKEIPSEQYKKMLYETDPQWNKVCNARSYAHIRLCGRRAQKASEDRTFLLDDVFRIYGYSCTGGDYGPTKYDYNQNANLWIFYIGVKDAVEQELSIWVQSPNSDRAHKFIYGGISKTTGLKLKPNPRDKTAYKKYVEPFENELKLFTTRYYDEFAKAFKDVYKNFKNLGSSVDELPANSFAEWPYELFYI